MNRNLFWGVALSGVVALSLSGCGRDDGGGNAGSGGDGGTGGTAGSAGSAGNGGAGGMAEEPIHGCTSSAATDLTGQSAVTITDVSPWMVPHQACIRISAGTEVTWEGNFGFHPLEGGVSPMTDESSPITEGGLDSGTDPATVTLDAEGTYPYFCGIHVTTMQGVIYVVP